MATARTSDFEILWNGKTVTRELTPYIISIEYIDKVVGETDELSVTMEDSDGHWRNEWQAQKGDMLKLNFGYDGILTDSGEFKIDSIRCSGPPDVVTIKALASWTTTAIRTKVSKAYEGQTLRQIAEAIAKKHGLTVEDGTVDTRVTTMTSGYKAGQDIIIREANAIVAAIPRSEAYINGTIVGVVLVLEQLVPSLAAKGYESQAKVCGEIAINLGHLIDDNATLPDKIKSMNIAAAELFKMAPTIVPLPVTNGSIGGGQLYTLRFARITQNKETDLAFLARICSDYGFQFSIKGGKMVFVSIFDLEKGLPVLSVSRTDMSEYDMEDKAVGTYKSASVKYHNPKDRTLYDAKIDSVDNGDGNPFTDPTSEDTLEIRTKVENFEQAQLKAKTALYKKASQQVEGSATLPGNPLLIAGNNFEYTDQGVYSGKYHITESRHKFEKGSGWQTTILFKRVGYVDIVKQKRPKKKIPKGAKIQVVQ